MRIRDSRAYAWIIWGLVGVFGLVEAVAWKVVGGIPRRPIVVAQVGTAWIVMFILASLATRRMRSQAQRIKAHEHTHQASLGEIEQLQMQNAMLEIIARSVDATLAFQALASRIARLVPCDRVGLALLTENGQEFQTYTARVREEERRARPRPEIVFKVDQTILGSVVRSREALIVNDISLSAGDFFDFPLAGATSMILFGSGSQLYTPPRGRPSACTSMGLKGGFGSKVMTIGFVVI